MLVGTAGQNVIVSNAVTVPEGARVTLLTAAGSFRLDVQLRGDTFRMTLRGLGSATATLDGPNYSGPVLVQTAPGDLRASRHDVLVRLSGEAGSYEVPVLIATLRNPAQGTVTITAQARLPAG
jgi:hypothetical protein